MPPEWRSNGLFTLIPISIIEYAAKLSGQAVHRAYLDDLARELDGEDVPNGQVVGAVARAWHAGKLSGEPSFLPEPGFQHCPFIARHPRVGWLVVLSQTADGYWNARDATGKVSKIGLEGAECIAIPGKSAVAETQEKSADLVLGAIWRRKSIFLDALLATFLVNMLTLAASLYSMQVYDRVIPNQGFQTLYVLTTGVVVMILLELLIKHVRSYTLDRTGTSIDAELSEWFFKRSLGIRLECRPSSVGTLASQIKGFELIRGVLSSTTIFVLADVPFALFFAVVIYLIGGPIAVVPLILFPCSLITGLLFQRQILRYTKENQGQSNRKSGLLVESIDGAESIKSNGAEWKVQGRWNQLVLEAGESDEKVRNYSTLSQHMTVALQQLGYVGVIGYGAYLVTENQLTMGALIACAIICNRALSPIAQLPTILVQIAQAKTAAEALDMLISLPNEIDNQADALVPGAVEAGISFQQAKFSYGEIDRIALEIAKLEIKPGERVGVLGAIGSGKSTLLKLASGLYRPMEGRVLLGDLDMALISPQVLRESIAYLPQEMRLISGTLRDNLLQGLPDHGDEPILDAARRTGLIELVTNHPKGLALPITEGGRGISGGQRQLIGLTRMVLAKPAILILDEPTSSMDAITEAKVISLLGELAASGVALLIATHKSTLLPVLDRLLVLQGGRFIIDGPRDLVLAKLSGKDQSAAG